MTSPLQAMQADAPGTRLCIAWRIGTGADRADARGAELRWSIDGALATATLDTGGASTPQPLAEARVMRHVHDEQAGLDHLEVEGLLWLTLRRGNTPDAPPRLLFARTTLLARLNIPGGRYSAPELLPDSETRP